MQYFELIEQTIEIIAQSPTRPTSLLDLEERVRHEALKVAVHHDFGEKLTARFVKHCVSYAKDTVPTLTPSKVTYYTLEGLKLAMGELENVRVNDLHHAAILVIEPDDVTAANLETIVLNMESRL